VRCFFTRRAALAGHVRFVVWRVRGRSSHVLELDVHELGDACTKWMDEEGQEPS
jgi:hypothetical protein